MGFHGFCAGLAIDLLLFAGFWRWRNAWTLRRACGMAALAVLAMLAHPVAIACGAAGLAVLFVADGETARRIGRRALAVLPFAVAGGAVLFVYRSTLRPWGWPLARKLTYLLTYRTLYTLDPRQVALGHAAAAIAGTAVVLAVLASRTTAPRAGAPFAWMAAALTACYLVTPDQGFGGSILGPRLALYPGLVLLPWLAARLPRRSVPWFAAAWTLWTLAELSILLPACRARDRELRAYLAPLETLPSGASVWIAPVDERPAPAKVPAFLHAAGYAAAERGLLLWPNYEVEMAFFPIARRSPTAPNVDSEAVVDYGYGWRLPPDSPARSRLDRELELVSTSDAGGSLYRRRAHQPRRGRDLDPTHAHQRPATGGVAGRHSR